MKTKNLVTFIVCAVVIVYCECFAEPNRVRKDAKQGNIAKVEKPDKNVEAVTSDKGKIDYVSQFNEASKPANYDPNNNAASCYQGAVKSYVEISPKLSDLDLRMWPAELSQEKRILLEEWIEANKEAIKQIEIGSQKAFYWPEYHGKTMFDISVPLLKNYRGLSKAICSRAKNDAIKENYDQAFSDVLIVYRSGQHMTGKKTQIEQLAGIAIKNLAIETGTQICQKSKEQISPITLNNFQEELQKISSKECLVDLTDERFNYRDNIQRVFTEDSNGDGHIPVENISAIIGIPEELQKQWTKKEHEQWAKIRKRETGEYAEKVFNYLDTVLDKTPAQLRNEGIKLQQVVSEMTNDNPFILLLMPAIEKVMEISHRSEANAQGLLTTLALLQYKADKGTFPNTLQELITTGYMGQLPKDPFSDGPLVYKKTNDNFMLYSIGENFKDDGGVHSAKWDVDYVFWPVH